MKAKRGDSVAIIAEKSCYASGTGRTVRTEIELGTVTSITRDGAVKAYRSAGWSSSTSLLIERVVGFKQLLVIPAGMVDPADVLTVAKAHHWDGHPNQPKHWESVEELRAALRPYLIEQVAA